VAVNPDFRDLFAALNEAGAKYLLVGGYALAYHSHPRYTRDLDVWVEPTDSNARAVLAALGAFGAPLGELRASDLMGADVVFQIGVPPNRIDVVTGIDGLTFAEAWPNRLRATFGDQAISVIGRQDLVRNKRASGRPQDLLDAETLETL
jgi:hypothetical protein